MRIPTRRTTDLAYVIWPRLVPHRLSRVLLTPLSDSPAPARTETDDIETKAMPIGGVDQSSETLRRFPAVSMLRSRTAGFVVTAVIVGLTLATAYIHLGLGGVLFTLNGLGYLGLAGLIVIGAAAPAPIVKRFSWFPRVALMGYAAMTIAGYLVMGPYFTLGWIAKGIEVTLIAVVALDFLRVYGSPKNLVNTALESLSPVLPARFRPTAA